MHSSTLATLVFLAAVTPALSAPVVTPPSCSSLRQGTAAHSTGSGVMSDILCFTPIDPSSVSSGTPSLRVAASSKGSAMPNPPMYSFSKVPTAAVSAQGVTTGQSGAISFGDLKNIASIASSGFDIVKDLFGGSGNQQQRRSPAVAQSGAFSLEEAKDVASIGSSLASVFHDIFRGNGSSRREFIDDLLARADVEGLVARANGQRVNPAAIALLKLAMKHGRALNELD